MHYYYYFLSLVLVFAPQAMITLFTGLLLDHKINNQS